MKTKDKAKNKDAQAFLSRHNFSLNIADSIQKKIIVDMKKGLLGKSSQQAMITALSATVRKIEDGESAIVIDAGGTNFRSCLVTKKADGLEISNFQKTSMPATDRELSKKEFYKALADNICRLKDLSDKISFCFSYAMEITEGGDGKILGFSKEVKATQAVGTFLGKELLEELKNQGWKKINKINVLNDTAALLLSTSNIQCKSRIAFILGTGMNSAFIFNKRIIVTECGMFSSLKQSDFDKKVCKLTKDPKKSLLEKMCSGAYLGSLAYEILTQACSEGYFSVGFINVFKSLESLSTADFDGLFDKEKKSSLSMLIRQGTEKDISFLKEVISAIILRSANLTAVAVYAAISLADEEDKNLPICIAFNGSTFWKTPMLKDETEKRLKNLLSVPFEIIKIEDDITKGSFSAAFI